MYWSLIALPANFIAGLLIFKILYVSTEKIIYDRIDSAKLRGRCTELFLEELYLKYKDYIDERPTIRDRFYFETMEYRQIGHVKYRMIFEGKTRRFVSVNLREVAWLR